MEVHHPHHVGHKKKWTEYLLEFLMLFLAVFLGFTAENIREHKIEDVRAKQFAKSLVNDLKSDTAAIEFYKRTAKRFISISDTLFKLNKNGLIYPCACSRREIADSAVMSIEGPVYSGRCRNGLSSNLAGRPHALRVKTECSRIEFCR